MVPLCVSFLFLGHLFGHPKLKPVQQQCLWPKNKTKHNIRKNCTYRSRVYYPVYVIRTNYTYRSRIWCQGIYYRIYLRNNNKMRQQDYGVPGIVLATTIISGVRSWRDTPFCWIFRSWERSGATLVSIQGVHTFSLAPCC